MKELLKKITFLAMSAALTFSLLPAVPAQAAKKKLSVNKVYNTTTRVKGKTKKKYQVRIKIGKKTYKATASKKGNYSVKIPKQAAGKALTVKAYRKKGKKWKYYTKKKTYVLAKTITVSKFSKTSKTIKGYARPKYKIKVTMNGKTYTKKASSKKGYFSIKMKKAAGNATATIKLYNTKGKYVKAYKKKAYNASSGSNNAAKSEYTQNGKPYTGKMPGLMDPINVAEIERKANSTQTYTNHTIYCESDTTKNFYDLFSGYGHGKYGYVPYYMRDWSDNEYQWYTAKNGVTLYYVTAKIGNMQTIPTPDASKPETYEGVIKSGQTGEFSPTFRDSDRNIANMGIKIVGYKNGKPVMFYSTCEQLIAGTVGKPVVIK